MASQNVETCRAVHHAFNRRDFDGVVSKMAEGVTYVDRARNATFTGRNGFKEFMQGWVEAFSNAAVVTSVVDKEKEKVKLAISRAADDVKFEALGDFLPFQFGIRNGRPARASTM